MSIKAHLVGCRLLAALIALSAGAAPGPALSAVAIGQAEKIVGQVYGQSLLRALQAGAALNADQRVRTGVDSAADLRFLDQSQLVVGARTEVVLDRFVYDPGRGAAEGLVNVLRGVLRFASSGTKLDVTVKTRTATIGVRGTVFDVFETPRGTEIAVHEGRVQVDSRQGSTSLGAGQSLTVAAAGNGPAAGPVTGPASGEMRAAVSAMLALVGRGQTPSETGGQSPDGQRGDAADPAAVQAAVAGRDPDSLLYLELAAGPVVIALRPDLAPRHVARIKQLARQGFYDGVIFHSVVAGLVAQSGDPSGSGRGGSGVSLAAEFSQQSFTRGAVGMRHDRGRPDSADSQFFICLKDCTQFNGRYTLWGQVIHGMPLIDRLNPGQPPANPDKILRMRLASESQN